MAGARPAQEFLAATLSQHQMEKAENMRAAFAHFDTDGSGTISKDELRQALQVGARMCAGVMARVPPSSLPPCAPASHVSRC